jgi:hypothetical protein
MIPKERMVTSPLLIKFLSSPHRRHLTYNDWQLIQSLGFVVWPTDDNELAYVNTETLADVLETITADPVERTTTPRSHADPVQTFDAKMSYTEHTPTYRGAISSYRNHIPYSTQAIPFSTDPLVDDDNMILSGANNLATFLTHNFASHQDSGHIAKPIFDKVNTVPENYFKSPDANGIPSVTEKMPTITNPIQQSADIPLHIQHISHTDDIVSQTADPVPQNVSPLHALANPLPAYTSLDFVPFESQRHTLEGREEKDHNVNSVENILAGNLDYETGVTANDIELDNGHTQPISDESKNGAETGGEDYTTVASEPNDTSTVDEDNNALGEHKIFTNN